MKIDKNLLDEINRKELQVMEDTQQNAGQARKKLKR